MHEFCRLFSGSLVTVISGNNYQGQYRVSDWWFRAYLWVQTTSQQKVTFLANQSFKRNIRELGRQEWKKKKKVNLNVPLWAFAFCYILKESCYWDGMLESMVIIKKLWRLYYNAIFCFKIDSILYIEGCGKFSVSFWFRFLGKTFFIAKHWIIRENQFCETSSEMLNFCLNAHCFWSEICMV